MSWQVVIIVFFLCVTFTICFGLYMASKTRNDDMPDDWWPEPPQEKEDAS